MHTQLVVVFVSGFLALLGIRIFISSFDDNDGDGMTYSTRDSYQFSILEVAWHLSIGGEIFSRLTPLWQPGAMCGGLLAIAVIVNFTFS